MRGLRRTRPDRRGAAETDRRAAVERLRGGRRDKLGPMHNDPAEQSHITQRLAELRLEHRDLDAAIARLHGDAELDELAIKRMKKRKLQLKDAIAKLESALIPDLDA